MTMPPRPGKPEVITKTLFTQPNEDKLWYWETKSITNEVIGNSQEGFQSLREAIQDYFSAQNADYQPLGKWPADYGPLSMLPENMYQINKYLPQGN